MSKIIGKLRFDAETKKINSGVFSTEFDYSKNAEYNEMIKAKNYISVSQEEADLWKSNNQNGIEMCVIDGVLQLFVEADDVKLERAKEVKLSALKSFYSSNENWEITIKHAGNIKPALQPLILQQNTIGKFATTLYFTDVNGGEFQVLLTNAKAIVMLNDNNLIGYALRKKNLELVSQISNAKSVEEVEKIDIEKEFATVKKIITIS
jgi:hypothetical protein